MKLLNTDIDLEINLIVEVSHLEPLGVLSDMVHFIIRNHPRHILLTLQDLKLLFLEIQSKQKDYFYLPYETLIQLSSLNLKHFIETQKIKFPQAISLWISKKPRYLLKALILP